MARATVVIIALSALTTVPAFTQDILAAADSGDLAAIEDLLTNNPDLLDTRDDMGMTPLLVAVSSRHEALANWLLDRGADPTSGRDNGITALHYAALRGFPDLIERLVNLGLDINVQTRAGSTPLLHASGSGQFAATRKLLELGADTELANEYGRTPLLNVARESGDVDMARLLVENGANVDALDIFEDSPIVLASWRGFAALVDLLLDNDAEVPVSGPRGVQLIRYSAGRGLDRLMSRLVAGGADLSLDNGQGGGLVHAAASGGSGEIVRMLLEQGLAADATDMFGWTPLHYAAVKGRQAVVEILLDHGVDPNARTQSGHLPLSLAVEQEHQNVVSLLATAGAEQPARQFPVLTGPYLGQTPPEEEAERFALDIVDVNWGGHSSITFTPDATEAFWTNYRVPSDSGYGHSRIVGSRIENGRWTAPAEPAFEGSWTDGDDVPFFSHDGNRLYVLSSRPLPPGASSSDENIWIIDRTVDGWGDPYPAPGELNSLPKHWQFSLTSSGTVYLGGEGPEQLGRGDIYKSTLVDGAYTTPVNLGDVINTPAAETSPYIAPDESYLLFASSGHEGAGEALGIYISWNDGNGGWTEPVFTGIIGLCPIVTHDGRYLFYKGGGDHGGVHWLSADFLDDLRPSGM